MGLGAVWRKNWITRTVHLAQSAELSIPRSAKTQKTENSNLHGFELHRPSRKGTKLLFKIVKAIINHQSNSPLGGVEFEIIPTNKISPVSCH